MVRGSLRPDPESDDSAGSRRGNCRRSLGGRTSDGRPSERPFVRGCSVGHGRGHRHHGHGERTGQPPVHRRDVDGLRDHGTAHQMGALAPRPRAPRSRGRGGSFISAEADAVDERGGATPRRQGPSLLPGPSAATRPHAMSSLSASVTFASCAGGPTVRVGSDCSQPTWCSFRADPMPYGRGQGLGHRPGRRPRGHGGPHRGARPGAHRHRRLSAARPRFRGTGASPCAEVRTRCWPSRA